MDRSEQREAVGAGTGTAGTRFGPYELLQEIGRGAMGVVYRARQRDLERVVALKTINPQLLDSEMVERFVREGRAAARLGKHPNIVQVFDAGVIDGVPFLAMEFVQGVSIETLVRREGPLEEKRMLEIARKVALALDHAHRRGIVHRDIKPGNVMIDREGEPQLLDFGLAKDLTNQSLLSTEGSIIGTPAYMPPEQAQPGSAPVDRRSDVYSLGALMHHALSGEPPFRGDSMVATIVKVLTQDPPPLGRLAAVSRDTEAIIDKAMEKDPKRRYQTALEMADDLSRVIAGEPPKVRPLGPIGRPDGGAGRLRARHRLPAVAHLGARGGDSEAESRHRAARHALSQRGGPVQDRPVRTRATDRSDLGSCVLPAGGGVYRPRTRTRCGRS